MSKIIVLIGIPCSGKTTFAKEWVNAKQRRIRVNNAELLEYDHTRLVLAAFVCHLTGFKVIDRAIGGVYEVTMNKTKQL